MYEVVNFLETRKRTKNNPDQLDRKSNRRPARAVYHEDSSDSGDEDSGSEGEIRAVQNHKLSGKPARKNFNGPVLQVQGNSASG